MKTNLHFSDGAVVSEVYFQAYFKTLLSMLAMETISLNRGGS